MPAFTEEKPTVGRVVWVWLNDEDQEKYGVDVESRHQPFRADVLYVDEAGLAVLNVTDHAGNTFVPEDEAQIFDSEPSDCHSDTESYACWMPYQKAAREKAAREQAYQEAKKEEGGGDDAARANAGY